MNRDTVQGELDFPLRPYRPIAWLALAILVFIAAIAIAGLETLSTLRAYVGGEGLWSKGQKDAAFFLSQYAQTHDEDDYQRYRQAIAMPLGDRTARLELQKPHPDLEVARRGFIAGGNDPADVEGLVRFFLLFSKVEPMRHAVQVWTTADDYTLALVVLGDATRAQALASVNSRPAAVPPEVAAVLARLAAINHAVTPLENEFSATLGGAARAARTALVAAMLAASTVLSALAFWFARGRLRERQRYATLVASSEQRYRSLFQTSFDAILVVDGNQTIVDSNDAAAALFGYEARELADRPAGALLELPGDGVAAAERRGITRCRRKDGVAFDGEISTAGFVDREGNARRGIVVRDVSERLQHERLLTDENRLLSLLATGAALPRVLRELVAFVDASLPDTRAVLLLPNEDGAGGSCAGGEALPAPYLHWLALVPASHALLAPPGAHATHLPTHIDDLQHAGVPRDMEVQLHAAGVRSISVLPMEGKDRRRIGTLLLHHGAARVNATGNERMIRLCTDLGRIAIESRMAEDRVRYLAHYDELTGLPNRFLCREEMAKAVAGARRRGSLLGVLFVDLDRFKEINDSEGHATGDLVLQAVAAAAAACVRDGDLLCRLGGDEFVGIIRAPASRAAIGAVAGRILESVSRPITLEGRTHHIACSIGIAVFPEDGADADALIQCADRAMYLAKTQGRNQFRFHDAGGAARDA